MNSLRGNHKEMKDLKKIRLAGLERQIERVKRRTVILHQLSSKYSYLRLGIFVIGVVAVLAAFGVVGWPLGVVAIVVSLIIFNVVAHYHRLVDESIARHEVWLDIKQTHVARIKLDWSRIPASLSPSQLEGVSDKRAAEIESDLDLTGERSIHHLINTATSKDGSQRLRGWLVNEHPDESSIIARQKVVQELKPLSIFRDKLTMHTKLAARNSKEQWEGQRLINWLQKQNQTASLRPVLLVLSILSAANIILFILSRFGLIPNLWLGTFVIYLIIYNWRADSTGNFLDDAYFLLDSLSKFQAVLEYLEKFRYGKNIRLKDLCEPFLERQNKPSLQLKRLTQIVIAVSLQRNGIIWLILNAIVPWRFYFAYRLNLYKSHLTDLLPIWLDRIFELEALNSLATFSYLNPEYTFPQVFSASPEAPQKIFSVKQAGHPLISSDLKVCNDFEFNQMVEIVLITGSNMAGKSSFLRTLGVNLCLAYAGGPVNASSMSTTLFRLFTCIRISDSVTDGFSYFYAEVRRLRELLDEFENKNELLPIFFLVDEIFKGTNNRERLIGSRAYLQALVGRNSIGLVSTHDLELVSLAENNNGVENYHFKEDVLDGKMVFSYKLLPGPSESTNALRIMKMEGLPVEVTD